MPSKIQLDENLWFLYICLTKSDFKTIDFNAVGESTNLNPPAARMRYTRLRRQIESGTLIGTHGTPFQGSAEKIAEAQRKRRRSPASSPNRVGTETSEVAETSMKHKKRGIPDKKTPKSENLESEGTSEDDIPLMKRSKVRTAGDAKGTSVEKDAFYVKTEPGDEIAVHELERNVVLGEDQMKAGSRMTELPSRSQGQAKIEQSVLAPTTREPTDSFSKDRTVSGESEFDAAVVIKGEVEDLVCCKLSENTPTISRSSSNTAIVKPPAIEKGEDKKKDLESVDIKMKDEDGGNSTASM